MLKTGHFNLSVNVAYVTFCKTANVLEIGTFWFWFGLI